MRGRPREPRIIDPATHPKATVSLNVAAEFLDMHWRTVRARVETGELPGVTDGRIWRIKVTDLVAYEEARRRASE